MQRTHDTQGRGESQKPWAEHKPENKQTNHRGQVRGVSPRGVGAGGAAEQEGLRTRRDPPFCTPHAGRCIKTRQFGRPSLALSTEAAENGLEAQTAAWTLGPLGCPGSMWQPIAPLLLLRMGAARLAQAGWAACVRSLPGPPPPAPGSGPGAPTSVDHGQLAVQVLQGPHDLPLRTGRRRRREAVTPAGQ